MKKRESRHADVYVALCISYKTSRAREMGVVRLSMPYYFYYYCTDYYCAHVCNYSIRDRSYGQKHSKLSLITKQT